jgi:hypothetical protein
MRGKCSRCLLYPEIASVRVEEAAELADRDLGLQTGGADRLGHEVVALASRPAASRTAT